MNKKTIDSTVAQINKAYATKDSKELELAKHVTTLKGMFEKAKDFNEYVKTAHDKGVLAISNTQAKGYINVHYFAKCYGEDITKAYGFTKLSLIIPHIKAEKDSFNEDYGVALKNNTKVWSGISANRLKLLSRLIKSEGLTFIEAMDYLASEELEKVDEKAKELKAIAKEEKEAEFNEAVEKAVAEKLEELNMIDGDKLVYLLSLALSELDKGNVEATRKALVDSLHLVAPKKEV